MSERESGASIKHEIDKQQSVYSLYQSNIEEKQSHAKDQNANTTEIKSLEGHDKGKKQVSMKHFFTKKGKDSNKFHLLSQKATSEATYCEATLSMQDQICKAELLWAMKTAKKDLPFLALDDVPQLFQRIFPDSVVAQKMIMFCTKVSYVISHGLGPYLLQKTIDDIHSSPDTYYTMHFNERTTSQIKKQLDVLVRYYSDAHCEVRVRFLKALVFGHACAETVADELWRTNEEFSLLLKCLLSLSSDGPNVNKAIKTNISKKLVTKCSRQLVNTGSCQLHVVHNSFKKGVEACSEYIEALCIDLFNFFKFSTSRRKDYAATQQKLNLHEVVFLHHVVQSSFPCYLKLKE